MAERPTRERRPRRATTRFAELAQYETDRRAEALLPIEYCVQKSVVILGKVPDDAKQPFTVGLLDPHDQALLAELCQRLGRTVTPVQLNAYEIREAIGAIYDVKAIDEKDVALSLDADRSIEFSADQTPSKMIDDLLSVAVRKGATDVHIETYHGDIDLRFRIDGVLRQVSTPLSPENIAKVISRLKVLCKLDHVERSVAQDGRCTATFTDGDQKRRVDFRLSIVPGTIEQDAVLRVLDPQRYILDLDRLSIERETLARYKNLIRHPHGMILVTGPTCAGKTTTLYATIQSLRGDNLKIMSVEDPIEYDFQKVNQKNVSESMGFADYLRAFLRQNPDIILVGEVRDSDTADVAIRAATTGHLILSSLHTRDAIGAVARLRVLGIPNDHIAETLLAVMGQRLLRRICEACRREATPEAELVPLYYDGGKASGPFYRGGGCEQCGGTGYRGLVGIYELFQPDGPTAAAIGGGAPIESLRDLAVRGGYEPLVEDALRKVHAGVTTLDEVARRVGPKYPYRKKSS